MSNNEDTQKLLDRILTDLNSNDEARELAAINELETIEFSSEAIVSRLKHLALQNNHEVREAALRALSFKTSQYVASKVSSIDKTNRTTILGEVSKWQKDGLIEEHRAEVIKRQYDFDIRPGIPIKEAETQQVQAFTPPAASTPIEELKTATPPKPAEPRPSITQILLSETSIRIYLYLGAFFVIASAVILAALVEAARLPILLVATLIFAGGAVGFHKRLPQPSFVLAIVFSFLLPIDAIVIADSFSLSGRTGDIYWAGVFLVMALIWGFGTWFYESRIFSIASFLAITLGMLRMGNAFNAPDDWIIFSFGLASLIGLFGVHTLTIWKGHTFAQPLFFTTQGLQAVTLSFSLGLIATNIFARDVSWDTWIAHTFVWIFAASFYAASNILVPFFLFPWAAVASLFLTPWLFLSAFDVSAPVQIAGFGVWGTIMALSSEFANRSQNKTIRLYSVPLLALSLPLFSISVLWGFIEEIQYAFAALFLTAIAYTTVHAMRPRWYVWSTALLAGLGAYFVFFALPFMAGMDVYFGYQLLIAALLLLIPELFFKESLTFARSWNWPPVVLGIFLTSLNILIVQLVLLDNQTYFDRAAITLGVYAILFAAYALRFRQPMIGYFATTSLALSLLYTLIHFDLDLWLPALTTLGAAYYFGGVFLVRKTHTQWGNMLVVSGLALGAVLSTAAVLTLKITGGWYAVIISALFLFEMFTRKNSKLELPALALLNIALVIILNDFKVTKLVYYLFASSLIWLGGDAILHLTYQNREMHLLTKLAGGFITFITVMTITVNNGLASSPAAVCFAVYTAFFAAYALIYKMSMLGYISTASAALTMFYALDHFKIETWLPIFTSLSLAYYCTGLILRRKSSAWSEMFRYSGLALGSLVSALAVINLEATGGWFAAVVGLLFVVETVTTRNGWFEAGVHILFSVAAFLSLRDFNIHEYSYILFAVSLVWLGGDLLFEKTLTERKVAIYVRIVGGSIAGLNAMMLLTSPSIEAAICYGGYALFFAVYALLYNQPLIGYASTVSLPLAVFFGLRAAGQTQWLFPMIAIAVLYYAAGYVLRRAEKKNWDDLLLFSGIGLGTLTALVAPTLPGGVEKAIPIAIAATLFAVEAYTLRNVWLAFPANGLYLVSYFTLLIELDVDGPQYFSIGAALLGMLMHYLLVRAGIKEGAFIMGMLSQMVLLGTSYIQLVSTSQVSFFFVLFAQSLVILAYGIYMRSRSLVIAPIGIVVLAILTILYSTLKDLSLVVIIGVAGIILLGLGVLAVLMRERITTLAEQFSDWNA